MRSLATRCLCVSFLLSLAFALLAGCGSGGPNTLPPGGSVGEMVQRLAGDYDLSLQQGSHYAIHIDGATNSLTGSGTLSTQPPIDYNYSGTLTNAGAITLHVNEVGTGKAYDLSGSLTFDAVGTASGSGTWQSIGLGTSGLFTLTRTRALPVASGPNNSLIGTLDLGLAATTPSRGLSLSPDGKTLYAFAGGKIYFVNTATGQVAKSAAIGDTASFLATSADGSLLFVGGNALTALDVQTGAVRADNLPGPIKWLTAPTTPGSTQLTYAGAADGSGHQFFIDAFNDATDVALPSLGSGAAYDAAAITADNAKLLVSTAKGAALVDAANLRVAVTPFMYVSPLLTASTPAVASPNGRFLYAVGKTAPPRIYAIDMNGQTTAGTLAVGAFDTQISDIAVTSDGARLVLAASNVPRVFIVDTTTLTLLQVVDVNVVPNPSAGAANSAPRIALSRDGGRAYVSGQSAIAVLRLK